MQKRLTEMARDLTSKYDGVKGIDAHSIRLCYSFGEHANKILSKLMTLKIILVWLFD